ncbi:GTPase ObgE [Patescibacteria group bacterium]|nr:GTPase ObgE [Patescibacteria group bacterium]
MAFVDEVTIHAQAGRGGNGVVRWLHAFGKEKGGPSGGDGGRGGDVVLLGVRDLAALAQYRYEKKFRAKDGEAGSRQERHGADGAPSVLKVPVGTTARVVETGEEFDITVEDEPVTVFSGGRGGFGNAHFKSSTNQNPFKAMPGLSGGSGDIEFTLKLIADAGFVGLPNAGKSSLLNALTRARSKVGAYPFTTLEPNLGDFYGYILADIPGLIEGASSGRGLGTKFLKHVERTKMLVHLVSAEQDDPALAYREVRKELESFGQELVRKEEWVILSKIDLVEGGERETKKAALAAACGREVGELSVEDEETLKKFSDALARRLSAAAK